jgi:hypothetical protein
MLYYFDSLDDGPLLTETYTNIKCYILLLLLTLQSYMGFGLLHKIIPASSIFDDLTLN